MEIIDRICREHQITSECKELEDIYPFVERNNSTEVLKINNTIIHTIVFK